MRVAGAGHSFTDAVLTDGTLLSLRAPRPRARRRRRPPASCASRPASRSTRSSERLAAHGLACANLGDIDVQSIAGATATGTHGTGARLRNLSAAICARSSSCSPTAARVELDAGDELLAARVSLGALGVVSAVTVQAVPAFTLEGVDAPAPLDETLDRLDELGRRQRPLRVLHLPAQPAGADARPTTARTRRRRPRGRARAWADDILLKNHAFGAFCRVGRARPQWIPALNRAVSRAGGDERGASIARIASSPRRGSCASPRWSTRSRARTSPTPSAPCAR